MATPDITAAEVMNSARAYLNDVGATTFDNTVLLPYLKTAVRDLRELMQQSNLPVTNEVEEVLNLTAGTTEVSFVTTPALPQNLTQIRQIWERQHDNPPWVPMKRVEFLPYWQDGQLVQQFSVWAWIDNKIKLLESSQDNDLKLNFIKQLLQVVDENSVIGVINGESFLAYRTGSLAARWTGEDIARADQLDDEASNAWDRLASIENKGKQAIYKRRLPFRMGWKNRGLF